MGAGRCCAGPPSAGDCFPPLAKLPRSPKLKGSWPEGPWACVPGSSFLGCSSARLPRFTSPPHGSLGLEAAKGAGVVLGPTWKSPKSPRGAEGREEGEGGEKRGRVREEG